MKPLFLISLLWLFSLNVQSQSVKKISDPHLTAQQQRMVITRWGNWLPEPHYFLGIQTNIHYTMVWGWLAPSRNRSYKQGADIRPLGPTGEQTQRMLLNAQLLESSRQIKKLTDSIAGQARSELYQYSALFASVDPLWRLYYRNELDPVLNFNPNQTFDGLTGDQLLYLQTSGLPEWYIGEMSRLQERLDLAFKTDMERGSRIMAYHRLLLDYRSLQNRWEEQLAHAEKLWQLKSGAEQSRRSSISGQPAVFIYSDQADLMRKIIIRSRKR